MSLQLLSAAITTDDTGWHSLRACGGPDFDPDVMFPEDSDRAGKQAAKRVCRSCPVKNECLSHALVTDERFGVWGGTTERERASFKRRDRPSAVAC